MYNVNHSVFRPLNFKLRYEFIDFLQDGSPINAEHEHECNRKFVSSQMEKKEVATFRSTKNIFMFGRGGATSLKCVEIYKFICSHLILYDFLRCTYRFEGQRDERVRIVLKKISTGRRKCFSKIDFDTNRSYCFGDTKTKFEANKEKYEIFEFRT